jgi:CBS domain
MKVSEAMTKDVRVANPEQTLRQAARMMAELDAGILPVGENDRLIGMITDRDIAIRGVGQGKGPKAKVRDVMTADIKYCFDDQDLGEVTRSKPHLYSMTSFASVGGSSGHAAPRLMGRTASGRGRRPGTTLRAEARCKFKCAGRPQRRVLCGHRIERSPLPRC